MMGFLVQEEEEDNSSSSSSSSSIGFVVKHPMQGLRIPNHLSPRFVFMEFLIRRAVVDGVDIHTTMTIEKRNSQVMFEEIRKAI